MWERSVCDDADLGTCAERLAGCGCLLLHPEDLAEAERLIEDIRALAPKEAAAAVDGLRGLLFPKGVRLRGR